MKLAIIGSRTFTNYQFLKEEALLLKPNEIVSGGAKGADALAEQFAKEYNLILTIFYPKFIINENVKYHPRYFFERNKQIVEYAEHILAFQLGNSKGTQHAIDYATSLNKPLTIYRM